MLYSKWTIYPVCLSYKHSWWQINKWWSKRLYSAEGISKRIKATCKDFEKLWDRARWPSSSWWHYWLFREKRLGFSPGLENTTGSQIVKSRADALFYIQPHYNSLQARIPGFHPPYFSALLSKVYNDPTTHKHAVPHMKSEQLKKISTPLYSIAMLPMMAKPQWKDFSTVLSLLALNLTKYTVTILTTKQTQWIGYTPHLLQLGQLMMENR